MRSPTAPSHQEDWHNEGLARFQVGGAFFRHSSQTGRDLGILAAIAHKTQLKNQPLRILDAMTGCGIRPLRYALEAEADYIWANEGNTDLCYTLKENLSSLPPERYHITHQDANTAFFEIHQRQDFYDLIDIDSFGSPMPTLSAALWAIKLGGLLYLTSTDGRATSGHAPNKSLQTYGAYARSHPAVHEQGLRLLIGLAVQQAAARGFVAQPIFAFYRGEVNRVMVRVSRQISKRHQSRYKSGDYGFLAYCHSCGQFQTVQWKNLGRVFCPCSTHDRTAISGPLWLGPLHNVNELEAMRKVAIERASADSQSNHWADCCSLIATMKAEASMPPYYYPLAEVGRRGKMDIPPRDALISELHLAGFLATRTHMSAQAIKTNAPLAVCIALSQQINGSVTVTDSPPTGIGNL